MLRNDRFHSFAECLHGRHPFDAEEAQQNLRTSAPNDPERKGLLELLAERITQLPEAPTVRHTTMAHYVDGFVIPVPENKIDDYRRIAPKAGEEPQWEKHRQPHAGSSGNKATSNRKFVNQ